MQQNTVFLNNYQPPDYLCNAVTLRFDLAESVTAVVARLSLQRNGTHHRPLALDGDGLTLTSIKLDGRLLSESEYALTEASLIVDHVPPECELEIQTRLRPQDNTALSGLYRSGETVCTQCEAEGFRRITFYPDRPDVLARFTTTIVAPRATYPVLLSNGNLQEAGEYPDGRHWVTWHDPYPKPCYLFALVAGDLGIVRDRYVSTAGKVIDLFIYTEHHNADKCGHAMAALKKAMTWDEHTYGRHYDLDRYMIVAIDDFNMGAMENKGLNIFNTKYVLAKPATATDTDFDNIESVIGHEYFHNWSGNRVTCRDWFQLSLKEGFTVFREQQFSAAMGSAGVKRIKDVNLLRTQQFREDAGPMAHPVRPDSYQEINNFYTVTVYNKGAEVIRMLYRLLGEEGFRRGTDLYFEKYDGQSVTTDDFLDTLGTANQVDLKQFGLWYTQAGTPELTVHDHYDPDRRTYELLVTQSCPATPGQPHKLPFHIPLAIALLDENGEHLPLTLRGHSGPAEPTMLLSVRRAEERFVFTNVRRPPVASLLRGFSAPVKLNMSRGNDGLYFLMRHDTDAFSRWEAAQQIAVQVVIGLVQGTCGCRTPNIPDDFVAAFDQNLKAKGPDLALFSELLKLPSETYISEFFEQIDPAAIHRAVRFVHRTLATRLTDELLAAYNHHKNAAERGSGSHVAGHRAIKNRCLQYLAELEDEAIVKLIRTQLDTASNMTDSVAALNALSNIPCADREEAFAEFYEKWCREPLVIDKWFTVQATSQLSNTPERVAELSRHPAFNIQNPNRVYSLIGAFAHRNFPGFHAHSGAGYCLVSDFIIDLDRINPQVAARLLKAFDDWRNFIPPLAEKMRAAIKAVIMTPSYSRDVAEIASKSLHGSDND